MDQKKRTLTKALTWQGVGLIAMTLIGYVTTGSLTAAGSMAATASVVGLITYVLHERIWDKINWGRLPVESAERR